MVDAGVPVITGATSDKPLTAPAPTAAAVAPVAPVALVALVAVAVAGAPPSVVTLVPVGAAAPVAIVTAAPAVAAATTVAAAAAAVPGSLAAPAAPFGATPASLAGELAVPLADATPVAPLVADWALSLHPPSAATRVAPSAAAQTRRTERNPLAAM
jgi:hypothetical protein